jgi:hypothetical protein
MVQCNSPQPGGIVRRNIGLLLALLTVAPPALAQPAPKDPAPAPVEPQRALPNPGNPDTKAPVADPKAQRPPAITPNTQLLPSPAEPIAGYANGSWFIRDPHNWFVLFPKGRLQVDLYTFPGRGAPPDGVDPNSAKDPRPKTTLFVRRVRPEIQGIIANHFEWTLGGEFGTVPATGSYGTLTDAFINVNYTPYAQVQVGQFDAPFTLENRTSDKFFDFMERSIAVRDFGVPSNKEAGGMVWGYFPNKLLYYSAGLFDGAGQDFKGQDEKTPAIIGRAFIAPVAPWAHGRRWLEELWVGGSIWWQDVRSLGGTTGVTPSTTGPTLNDILNMTTQGGFTFFSSNYNNGNNAMGLPQRSHLAPNGTILKWALEANLPIWRLGLRWEFVDQSIDISQYNDTNPMNATLVRTIAKNADGSTNVGTLTGWATYIEAYGWLLGDRTMLEPPGIEPMPRLREFAAAPQPKWGLMGAFKYERLQMNIGGLPQTVSGTTAPMADPAVGRYVVDTFEWGLNAWLTKHVRLTVNYVLNYIGGVNGGDKAVDAKMIQNNFYYGRAEHELLFRAAIAL